jgi:2-hydroxy-6-oxonona-2,4-dienedioate hydrolase
MVETAAPEHADVVVHQKDANSTSLTGSRQNANFSRRLGVVRVAAIPGLLVLVAAGVAIYLFFRADMLAARARLLTGSRVLSTACGPIEVAEEGDGPPVLVVHGTGGGYDQGLNFLRRSTGEGFHRIAISRFGYLRTPQPPDISSAAQAQSFVCALDALGLSRVAVVGVSAGAHPAAQFALSHPERVAALALIVPALYTPPEPGATPASGPPAFVTDYVLRSDFLVWLIARLAPGMLLEAAGVPRSVQPDLSPQLRNELVDGFSPASARHVGLGNDIRNAVRGWPDLPIEQLEMPVLLVGAADDPYQSGPIVRYSSRRIPVARMVLVERGGHILVGHERRIQEELRDFLTGITNK